MDIVTILFIALVLAIIMTTLLGMWIGQGADKRAMLAVQPLLDNLNLQLADEKWFHQENIRAFRSAGALIGHVWSVESTNDGWTGEGRQVKEFDNIVDFLWHIEECKQAGRGISYTRVHGMVLSN